MSLNKYGKLIIWSLKDLAGCVDGIIRNDFDSIIMVEGNTGNRKINTCFQTTSKIKVC